MKVLNLYAGIGGNRKLWTDVEVTAVELKPEIASIYQGFYPNDKVVVGDAHDYLLHNFEDFDFIWSSPPCPSHSRIRNIAGVGSGQNRPIYPDMKLYEEIIFLQQVSNSSGTRFKGKRYCVENVRSYYEPLIRPHQIGMHYFWTNFHVAQINIQTRGHNDTIEDLKRIKQIDCDNRLYLRNCTEPEIGLHILNYARKQEEDLFKLNTSANKEPHHGQ